MNCRLQDPGINPPQKFDTSSLEDILPEIPFWIKSPDYERVEFQIEACDRNVCVCLCIYYDNICFAIITGRLAEQIYLGYVAILR